jgi:hypothetical protein
MSYERTTPAEQGIVFEPQENDLPDSLRGHYAAQ